MWRLDSSIARTWFNGKVKPWCAESCVLFFFDWLQRSNFQWPAMSEQISVIFSGMSISPIRAFELERACDDRNTSIVKPCLGDVLAEVLDTNNETAAAEGLKNALEWASRPSPPSRELDDKIISMTEEGKVVSCFCLTEKKKSSFS
jgi:hypothetical protein